MRLVRVVILQLQRLFTAFERRLDAEPKPTPPSRKISLGFVGTIVVGFLSWLVLHGRTFSVLQPAGLIADRQRSLMAIASLLAILVVVPVFVLTFWIVWKFRDSRTDQRDYLPELDGNRWLETTWWLIPLVLIVVLSGITWRSTHELDPFKPIASTERPLRVQVVALQWKWLFLYPDQHVASVDYLQFPAHRPLNLEITSDAPMNSFWIPQLGGQVYAMSGMSTQLHLIAARNGDYRGSSANISGRGFADMDFTAEAVKDNDFANWTKSMQHSKARLDGAAYSQLAQPGQGPAVTSFRLSQDNLYDTILMKYMGPEGAAEHTYMEHSN